MCHVLQTSGNDLTRRDENMGQINIVLENKDASEA